MREAQGKTIYLKDYSVPEFLIDETHLAFDLHEDHSLVSSRLVMRRNLDAADKSAALVLDGVDLELVELSIDGKKLSDNEYKLDAQSLTIGQTPEQFELRCVTKIFPQKNTSLEGLYKSRSMFCTQCEAQGFRKITYYLDRPDVLSIYTTTIEADANVYPTLLSNGEKQSSKVLDSGRTLVTWHDPFKKPCYLFALVAGDLECVSDTFTTMSGRKIDLQIFVEQKDVDKCDHAMNSLKASMRWDEEVYGREYDLDLFMIVAVDDFNAGAMENKGLNIFNTSAVLANPATTTDFSYQRVEGVVAHEYFHNWSGNRVTCRDWFQLSLKEGLTVYRDAEFSADMNSRGVKRIESVNFLRTYQFPEDAGPTAHPIRPAFFEQISNFYTVTVYEKGAEVVRMLAHLLGPDKFRQATDLYFQRFDGQAVTCDDFVDVMQEVGDIDLQQFRHWYSQAGTPELKIQGDYDANAQRYTLHVEQSCPATPETPKGESKKPFVIPLAMGLVSEQGDLSVSLAESQNAGTSKAQKNSQHVLVVDQAQQSFIFENVTSKPTPSLLRGFSAPVKLKFEYSRDELLLLWQHDSDDYARWDAGQQLALLGIMDAVKAVQNKQPLQMGEYLLKGMAYLLEHATHDDALLAEMLTLPNATYVAEQYASGEVDVHAIHQARTFFIEQISAAFNWQNLYEDYQQKLLAQDSYTPSAEQIALRRMKNLALYYLLQDGDDVGVRLCAQQFQQADNMTDSSAALRGMVHCQHPSAQALAPQLLNDFYEKWQHEPLVVNLWLQIQASNPQPDTLEKVKALMEHPAFDANNPNKLRSVIGVFASSNPVAFHDQSGAGYEFLADQVLRLDTVNSQVASRLLTPLSRWRNFLPAAASLMKAQLQRIADQAQAKNVLEQVNKSLK